MIFDSQQNVCVIPDIEPWISGRQLAIILMQAGFETYAAGGCVRDLILGQKIQDIDLATAAHPEQVEAVCAQQGWQTVAVGKSFGVIVVVMPTGMNIEVATFRSDGAYIDGRRPQDVTFTGTAKNDVERRDFTINALLINIVNGQVLDYVGGCADIKKRIIAAVGDPAARLNEDRLRVLRALRFAARLGFHMTESTWVAVCRTRLDGVSRERVVQEWKKAMAGPGRGTWFELVQRSGHLSNVCAPVATYDESARQSLRVRLDQITATDQESLILALWLLDSDQASAVAWMDSMPLSSAWKRSTTWLLMHGRSPERLRGLSIAERRRCWRHADGQLLARLLVLQGSAAVADLVAECAQEPSEPLIPLLRAEDLMRLSVLPGPDLGVLLRRIEDGQLAGLLSSVADATKMVHDWLREKTKET